MSIAPTATWFLNRILILIQLVFTADSLSKGRRNRGCGLGITALILIMNLTVDAEDIPCMQINTYRASACDVRTVRYLSKNYAGKI